MILQQALTKVHIWTAWHAALLDSFNCTCLDISQDSVLVMTPTNQYVCACCTERGMFWGIVLHIQSSEDIHWQVSWMPGCPHGRHWASRKLSLRHCTLMLWWVELALLGMPLSFCTNSPVTPVLEFLETKTKSRISVIHRIYTLNLGFIP